MSVLFHPPCEVLQGAIFSPMCQRKKVRLGEIFTLQAVQIGAALSSPPQACSHHWLAQTHDWGGLWSRTERRGNGVRPRERTPCHAHRWWMLSLPGLHCPSSSLLGGSAIPPHFKTACSDLVLSILGILHMYLSSPLYNGPERSDLFSSCLLLREEKKLQDIQDHRKLQDSGSGASDTQVCSYSNQLTFLQCIPYALTSKVPTS